MRQRLGLTVSGAAAPSLMKLVNLERSQTILPFVSLMTPSSGNRAMRPRFAFAKSALSDHGSEAVEFLLKSRVDGDTGSPAFEAVCAATLRGAANNPTAVVAAVRQITSRRFRFKLDITTSVLRIAAVLWRGCKIERFERWNSLNHRLSHLGRQCYSGHRESTTHFNALRSEAWDDRCISL